jgi:uncharacterized membrane protein
VLESIFSFLFKYRPAVYQRGQLGFESPLPAALVAIGVAVLLLVVVLTYRRARHRVGWRDVVVLAGLRAAALGLLLFTLLRPVMVVATVVPQENILAVVLDDSRSMQLADQDGAPRSDFLTNTFASEESTLIEALNQRFALRFFRFGRDVARHDVSQPLGFTETRTNLGRALAGVRRELTGVPLAGVVMVTDGADNAAAELTEPLLAYQADGIPIYTVGVGRDVLPRDIEISRVEAPHEVLEGSSVMVDVMLTQTGFRGDRVTLNVEDAGRIVNSQEVRLAGDREATMVRVKLTASEAGTRLFRFHIPPQSGELVVENNAREVMITVGDRREKILYFEGEPRFEVKFIRRAVAEDQNIQLVTLQRTAENKYLRLGVDSPDELSAGFPETPEELFAYRGLILGSVEASFFTHAQLAMIEEFVGRRGGGLLVLGGRKAFSEGGYAGTPLESVLPVVLRPDADPEFFREVEVRPTPAGLGHPVTRLADDAGQSGERWSMLPPISVLNPLGQTKPGASTLLTGRAEESGDSYVVLAFHRYGKGKAIAFAAQDSWLWQMHADIPLDDLTHETYWRQMLRWLVSNVPDPIAVTTPMAQVEPGERVTITADVRDSSYLGINGAQVEATVTNPLGVEETFPLEWTVTEDGAYRTDFAADVAGRYDIRVGARRGDRVLGEDQIEIRADPQPTEFFSPAMRAQLLKDIAAQTGGRFYTAASLGGLAEDVRYTEAGTTTRESYDLWDLPILFLVLLAFLGSEWILRRRRGLA